MCLKWLLQSLLFQFVQVKLSNIVSHVLFSLQWFFYECSGVALWPEMQNPLFFFFGWLYHLDPRWQSFPTLWFLQITPFRISLVSTCPFVWVVTECERDPLPMQSGGLCFWCFNLRQFNLLMRGVLQHNVISSPVSVCEKLQQRATSLFFLLSCVLCFAFVRQKLQHFLVTQKKRSKKKETQKTQVWRENLPFFGRFLAFSIILRWDFISGGMELKQLHRHTGLHFSTSSQPRQVWLNQDEGQMLIRVG